LKDYTLQAVQPADHEWVHDEAHEDVQHPQGDDKQNDGEGPSENDGKEKAFPIK